MKTSSKRRQYQRDWYARTKRGKKLASVPQVEQTDDEATADAKIAAAREALHGLREFREDQVKPVGVREWWSDPTWGMAHVTEVA